MDKCVPAFLDFGRGVNCPYILIGVAAITLSAVMSNATRGAALAA
jgi:hypothetical protein